MALKVLSLALSLYLDFAVKRIRFIVTVDLVSLQFINSKFFTRSVVIGAVLPGQASTAGLVSSSL